MRSPGVHSRLLALDGGAAEVRDTGLLESAYVAGIVRNHPFVDGNKRAAFAAIIVFLGLNGHDFDVLPEEATAIILDLAAGEVSEENLTRWIRDNWPKAK